MNHKIILQTFLPFANILNNNDITWALGGSLLLALQGYSTTVNDIDILIIPEDKERLLELLKPFTYNTKQPNSQYDTVDFYCVTYHNITIDIMIDFRVITDTGIFIFPFSKNTQLQSILIDQTTLYLSSIQDWKQAYIAMNRTDKIDLIHKNQPMIETTRLFIRPLQENDYIEMLEYMSSPVVLQYEMLSPFTKEELHQFTIDVTPQKSFYAVIHKEASTLIGHLYFSITGPKEFNEYTLGYIFNPKIYNQGYCTESAKAIIEYGFKNLKAHRVTARCNPDNIASWRVMEKIGMKKEGLLRKRVSFITGEDGTPVYWDELVYGILQEEYDEKKQ